MTLLFQDHVEALFSGEYRVNNDPVLPTLKTKVH